MSVQISRDFRWVYGVSMPVTMSKRIQGVIAASGLFCASYVLPAYATGVKVYSSRCAACHKADGAGVPGQFPRLKGRVGKIAATKDGRTYLIHVLLFGLFGPIDVDGRQVRGMMPPMGTLGDQDVADTLNFAVELEKPKKAVAPFTAAEVKAVRDAGRLTASEVAKQRAELAAKGLVH
ncbi:cytochrome c [Novosphingobium mangrovi (ex Huang et al. 2023)]|uniref:Cytochrome c n=1 Tax=Novosphingobium mangrovi (ex Huang et al. 2023) TaxID=2976432 RepID=A0ABT2I9K5_9SPHN|nr:cytochrome c [Novosphingobium mangrovi (ex Huang et al. 2023)]MCT2401466.1 cytochrome c [Novosphingobium mangrovi (ex Huang et al. 2023)]